ncbi:MAG TPA: HlyD family efflux transporter periplasmic adaptor subunit [Papillibacter sp.]|jgi:multidrug efflux pump subunit AcrA (membrane-fusion protein)|nr:HlyD family efflux transporter periplasmic adaptor subunit [Papillibacter sp.]
MAEVEQKTAVQAQQAAPVPATPKEPPQRKKLKRKKRIKKIIAIIVVAAILGGIAYGLYTLLRDEEEEKEILTDFVTRGSIQSMVTGNGVTKAKDAASITLSSSGTVLDVYVKEGDLVMPGQPLYTIDSSDALKAVEEAQKSVNNLQKQLNGIYESLTYLTVRADYAGTLLDTAEIAVGESVGKGTMLGKLVDDSKMKLELFFSYAYQDSVSKGQSATVSVPATMSQLSGTVTAIDYINKVTPEGARLFRVVITVDNPGALTAGMGATAVLKDAAGIDIYPFDSGALEYNRVTDIVTKIGGEAQTVSLLEYRQVAAGETLLVMSGDDSEEQIATLETQLAQAQEALQKAQENLDNFNAVAPIGGTVLFCALKPGDVVQSGTMAISIADTTVMTVEAQVDEMNVSYVKPGMFVDVKQWGRYGEEYFMGVVESVSLEGKFEGGVSYFPAIIRVDNYDGRLLSGMYVDYSLVASQSEDTLLVPVQSVKYTEAGSVVFVRTETEPENTLNPEEYGFEVPEGFYAVPVEVGLSDNYYAEILSGVEEGMEVFTQYMTNMGSPGMYW